MNSFLFININIFNNDYTLLEKLTKLKKNFEIKKMMSDSK
jgi:hypothetical protein